MKLRIVLIAISMLIAPHLTLAQVATSPSPPSQLIQQGRQFLSQSKYPDAVQCLDKAVSATTDARQKAEANELLKQTFEAWLRWLQTTQAQLDSQVNFAKQQLDQAEKTLAADKKAHQQKVDAENKIYETGGGHWVYYSSKGWVFRPNTRKGTGDPGAQTAIHGLQIKVMTQTAEVTKRTAELDRLQKQLLSIEQYIPVVQGRLQQLAAELPPTAQTGASAQQPQSGLKIVKATYGTSDVTAFVQNAVTGDSVTVRATPESFAISPANVGDGKLTIEYMVGSEKKTVTVDTGWTVVLPTLKLLAPAPPAAPAAPPVATAQAPPPPAAPPPSLPPASLPALAEREPPPVKQAPATPWYQDWRYIVGGLVGLYIILRVTLRPK